MDQDNDRLADFTERLVAFAVDYLLFVGVFFLTPRNHVSLAICVGGFILYQAAFSSGGRATLGKRLLGLRIVGADGEPLGAGAGFGRALMYIVSSALGWGFLVALVNRKKQAWHDLAVGSVVVSDRENSAPRAALIRLAGFAIIALALGAWARQNVLIPRQQNGKAVAFAQGGLSEVARLQDMYRARRGRYAPDLFALAEVSSNPRQFLRDMNVLYGSLSNVRFKLGPAGYRIEARANNEDRTLVALNAP